MKKVSYLLFAGLLATTFACNKEQKADETASEPINHRISPDEFAELFGTEKEGEFAEMFDRNMEEMTQRFYVSANEPFTVTAEGGTTVSSAEGAFTNLDGDLIDGEVMIEIVEVRERGDMVALDKATMGVTEDGGAVSALISDGEIFVRATQGGEEVLNVDPIRVEVAVDALDPDMQRFNEMEGTGDDLVWELDEENPDLEEGERDGGEGGGTYVVAYDILPGDWGWTNIDKFWNDPCPKTTIHVEVPAGHDPTNTEVYAAFIGEQGALANFDVWDGSRFTEHYGQICIGIDVHFIAVTNVGGGLEYGIQTSTIVNGHVEVFTGFTPISQAALIAQINALP